MLFLRSFGKLHKKKISNKLVTNSYSTGNNAA